MNRLDKRNVLPIAEENPETYMPGLQFLVRMMLGVLAVLYFYFLPRPPLIFNTAQIVCIASSYLTFHIFWWWFSKRFGAGMRVIRIGAWFDILGASVATLGDPFVIPPMVLLFLIAVLGNGIQHGLRVFVESMYGSLLFGGTGLLIHFYLLGMYPPYHVYVHAFLIAVGIYYSYMLVKRIELLKKEAVEISERDGLTGILNRRAFVKAAEYLLFLHERSHMPLVFVFGDLDNFKEVNDEFGHAVGDTVLQYFADMVRGKLRKTDIMARYGGDEFVFILTNTTMNSAENVALRLQSDFRAWARKRGMQVGISFGLAMVPRGKIKLDDILHHVDGALYEAKKKKGHPGVVLATQIDVQPKPTS